MIQLFMKLLASAIRCRSIALELLDGFLQLGVRQKNLSVTLADATGASLGSRTVEATCPGSGTRRFERLPGRRHRNVPERFRP
jgi:NADH:ubiquinone reductase (H+-translocating)